MSFLLKKPSDLKPEALTVLQVLAHFEQTQRLV